MPYFDDLGEALSKLSVELRAISDYVNYDQTVVASTRKALTTFSRFLQEISSIHHTQDIEIYSALDMLSKIIN